MIVKASLPLKTTCKSLRKFMQRLINIASYKKFLSAEFSEEVSQKKQWGNLQKHVKS